MTCDEAFDRLTSEPHVSNELQRHLAQCPRCRQMQDALSPALDAFEFREPLRTASPWLASVQASEEAVALARSVAGELSHQAATTRRWQLFLTAGRYAAVLLVGLSLGAVALPRSSPSPEQAAGGVPPEACTRTLAQSSTHARALVHTCVACHIARAD